MNATTAVRVPAGWYADPVGILVDGEPIQRRWWDGEAWTEHVAPMPSRPAHVATNTGAPESPDISPATVERVRLASAVQAEARREAAKVAETMPLHSASTGELPVVTFPVYAGTPESAAAAASAATASALSAASAATGSAGAASSAASGAASAAAVDGGATGGVTVARAFLDLDGSTEKRPARGKHSTAPRGVDAYAEAEADHSHRRYRTQSLSLQPTRVHTAALWLIVTMPITQLLLLHWVLGILPATDPLLTLGLAVVLPFVLYGALAAQDGRLLAQSGHLSTAPWGLAMVLPPVYLGIRGIQVMRTTGTSPWAPIFVWGLLQAAAIYAWTILEPAELGVVLGMIGF